MSISDPEIVSTTNYLTGDKSYTVHIKSGLFSSSIDGVNMYVLTMDDLKYTFDIPTGQTNDSSITFLSARIKVTVRDKLSDGTLISNELAKIDISFPAAAWISDNIGGSTRKTPFRVNEGDYYYRAEDKEVDIYFTALKFVDASPSITYPFTDDGGSGKTWLNARAWIEERLKHVANEQGGSSLGLFSADADMTTHFASYIRRNYPLVNGANVDVMIPIDNPINTSLLNQAHCLFVPSNASGTTYDGYPDLFHVFSALHGCFFGYGFGHSWFTHRLSNADAVTLSTSELMIMNTSPGHRKYNQVHVSSSYSNRYINYNTDSNSNFDYNRTNTLFKTAWIQGSGHVDTSNTSSVLQDDLIDSAMDAYAVSQGALLENTWNSLGTGTKVMDFKIRGLDTVLPYQPITLDSSFDAPFASTTWRPYQVNYSYIDEWITGKAYQVR